MRFQVAKAMNLCEFFLFYFLHPGWNEHKKNFWNKKLWAQQPSWRARNFIHKSYIGNLKTTLEMRTTTNNKVIGRKKTFFWPSLAFILHSWSTLSWLHFFIFSKNFLCSREAVFLLVVERGTLLQNFNKVHFNRFLVVSLYFFRFAAFSSDIEVVIVSRWSAVFSVVIFFWNASLRRRWDLAQYQGATRPELRNFGPKIAILWYDPLSSVERKLDHQKHTIDLK